MKLYKVTEIAQLLNISRAQAYRLIQYNKIGTIKINTSIRVSESDLEEYINRNYKRAYNSRHRIHHSVTSKEE
jgi:excisionase family DNA binding protein